MTERHQGSSSGPGSNRDAMKEDQKYGIAASSSQNPDSGSSLRREPTWVRSIDFHDGFDLNLVPSTSSPVSPQRGSPNDSSPTSRRQSAADRIVQGVAAGTQNGAWTTMPGQSQSAQSQNRSSVHSRTTSNYSQASAPDNGAPASPSASRYQYSSHSSSVASPREMDMRSHSRQTSSNQKTPPGNSLNQFSAPASSPRLMNGVTSSSAISTPPNGVTSEWSTPRNANAGAINSANQFIGSSGSRPASPSSSRIPPGAYSSQPSSQQFQFHPQQQQQQMHSNQSQFQSSADIYASSASQYQERPTSSFSMNRTGSRPGTSMSSSMHSADGGSTASNNTRDLRRGSVMSFQTALSGTGTGFQSGSELEDGNGRNGGSSPIDPREDIWNDGFDPVIQNGNARLQPWLSGTGHNGGPGSGSNHSGFGYGTSPDERIPGGWGSRMNTPPPSSAPQPPPKQQQQQQQMNQIPRHAHSSSQSRLMPSPQLGSKELSPRNSSPQLAPATGNRMSGVGLGMGMGFGIGHKASPSNTSSLHSRKVSEGSKSDSRGQTQSTTPNMSPSANTRFFNSSTVPSPFLSSSTNRSQSPALVEAEAPISTTAQPQSSKEGEDDENEDEDEEAVLKRHTTIRASGQSSHYRTPSQSMPDAALPAPPESSKIFREQNAGDILVRSTAHSPAPPPPPKESYSPTTDMKQDQTLHLGQNSLPQSTLHELPPPAPPAKVSSPREVISSVLPPSIVAASDIIPPPLPPSVVEAQRSHNRDLSAGRKFEPVPPADQSPVSDFRQKPLATITPQSRADGTLQLEKMQSQMREDAGVARAEPDRGAGGAIVGGERNTDLIIASMPQGDGPKNPMAPRRGSSGNLLIPKAVLAEAPLQNSSPSMVDLLQNDSNPDNSAMSESESISREPSPPPEGEIEARAQWVQAQMKLQQKRDKDKDKLRAQEKKERELYNKESSKSRSNSIGNNLGSSNGTLRSQLKPLQLVPDDLNNQLPAPPFLSNHNHSLDSPTQMDSPASASPNFTPTMVRNSSNLSYSGPANDPNLKNAPSSGGALSTQQLQRQSARDQRRSVGTLSMAMSGGDLAAGGSSGPYPAFSSPTTGATRPTGPNGARLYPGVLPQRSLVAPFELQQRPDGLLSGLIGPDGVRRSVNDPEVCLECMMRDEDMIDVQVIGQGLWERESDREFVEAVRNEEEEDRRRLEGRGGGDTSSLMSHQSESQAGNGSATHESAAKPNARGRLHKRIGKSDPLTAERLKLHTQMNPPASSHRWRTLQTFLAVQAKFIAMEQRARAETDAERKAADIRLAAARERERAHVLNAVEYDNRLVRARAAAQQDASALLRVAKGSGGSRKRSSSASLLKDKLVVEDVDLKADERAAKERDIASAREARRALAASEGANVSAAQPQQPSGQGRPPTLTALNTSNPNNLSDEEKRRFSSPLLANSAHSIPRRSGLAPAAVRAGSSQDLRSVPGAMAARGAETPASVHSHGSGLAPPSVPFGSNGTPRGFGKYGGGSATSQLSLAPSGSMVDMHVGLGEKDRNEHRLSQAGFVLPAAKGAQSPSALNRAFYGFPEMDGGGGNDLDGIAQANANAASAAAARQSAASPTAPMQNRSARGFDDELGPHAHEGIADDLDSNDKSFDQSDKPKKRGGLRGLFGGGKKKEKSSASQNDKASAIDRRDSSSRKSISSGSPRTRGASLGPDNSVDLAPPPGLSGLLQRARRSTSSLIAPSFDAERERTKSGSSNLQIYNHPPGMASSNSLDPGPFQPPVPPPRNQSKDMPSSQPTRIADSKKELRGSSSSPFMGPQISRGHPSSPIHASHATSPSGSRTNSMMSFQSRGAPPPPRAGSHRAGLNGATDYSAEGADRASIASRSSSRKDLPSTPLHETGAFPKHSRGPSGPFQQHESQMRFANGADGRAPVSATRSNQAGVTSPAPSSILQFSDGAQSRPSTQGGNPMTPPLSQGQQGPRRPPRSPHREGTTPSVTSSGAGHEQRQVFGQQQQSFGLQQPQQHHQQQHQFHQLLPVDATPPPESNPSYQGEDVNDLAKDRSPRKSKLLKLPFGGLGKKKRDSTLPEPPRSRIMSDGRASVSAGKLRGRKSQADLDFDDDDDDVGLAPPTFRNRVVSSPHDDRLPPRSQSSLGFFK